MLRLSNSVRTPARVVSLAAVGAFVALNLPASAATRPASIMVTGAAGTMADVTIRTPVLFKQDDVALRSTATKGGWAGFVVVAKAGNPVTRKSLVSVTMTEQFRCPGSTCRYVAGGAPPFASDYDARGWVMLPAGRYWVVLAGAAGATVTATLRPDGAVGPPVSVRTSARPVTYLATVSSGQGAAGRETLLHAYEQIPVAGSWSATVMYVAHAAPPTGVLLSVMCLTTGSENALTRQVGGVAPCADLQGFDVMGPNGAGLIADRMNGSYAPVGVAGAAITGPSDESFGVGFDIAIAAASVYQRSVFIGVSVN